MSNSGRIKKLIEEECEKAVTAINGEEKDHLLSVAVEYETKTGCDEYIYKITINDKTRTDKTPRTIDVQIGENWFDFSASFHDISQRQGRPDYFQYSSIEITIQQAIQSLFSKYKLYDNSSKLYENPKFREQRLW